jgi:DNA polymerase-3 subunit alpha
MFQNKFQKLELDFHGVRLPEIKIEGESDNYQYLRKLTLQGFKLKESEGKIPTDKRQIYIDRIKTELRVIQQGKLVDYYLLIYELLNWCDEQNIPRGIGRGSSSGSMVFWLMGPKGVTGLDPIKYDLPFSRFISEARLQSTEYQGVTYHNGKSLCDVDNDVGAIGKSLAVSHISEKYPNRTAKISTQNKFTGKLAMKEILKSYLEFLEEDTRRVSDLLEVIFGKVEKLSTAYQGDKDTEFNPKFKEWVDENPKHKSAWKLACQIEGLTKNVGVHPAAVALSYQEIDSWLPLQLTKDGEITLSFNMNIASELVCKIDILGLKQLNVLDIVAKETNTKWKEIDIDHESIYTFLHNTDKYYGIFQIEDGLTKKAAAESKPVTFDNLAAILAISRPSSFAFLPKFINYLTKGELDYIHPKIDEILKETANIPIYQEQVNSILIKAYGFNEIDAESVAYAIRKKKREVLEKWEPILYEQGKKHDIPDDVTKKIWDIIDAAADYAFSRNHSFVYAFLTACGCYYKANYPKEFFLALLQMAQHEPDTNLAISEITKELPHFNIKLLGPDLLKSQLEFSVENKKDIRYGLSSIKGVSSSTIQKLINFRKEYASKIEMFHAAKESGLNIGVLSALIQAGAMSDYETRGRSKLVLEAQTYNLLTDREKILIQQLFNNKIGDDILMLIKKCVEELKDENGKPLIKESRFNTIKSKYQKFKEIYLLNSRNEDLASYFYELNCIGFSYSQKLADIYKKTNPDIKSLSEVRGCAEKEHILCVGVVQEVISRKSKKSNNPYLKITVADEESTLECFLFVSNYGDKIQECRDNNNGKIPVEGDVLVITGSKKGSNAVYADCIGIQTQKVFTGLRQLSKEKASHIEGTVESKDQETPQQT